MTRGILLDAWAEPPPPAGVQLFDECLPGDPPVPVWLVDGVLTQVVETTPAPPTPGAAAAGIPAETELASILTELASIAELTVPAHDHEPRQEPAHGAGPGHSVAPSHHAGLNASAAGAFDLGEAVAACERVMSQARALQAALITELTRRPELAPDPSGRRYASVSANSCTALELTDPLRLTSGQAENLVAESVQLVQDLPATHAALSAGRIDQRRARIIQSELTRHDSSLAHAVENAVIDQAADMNPRQLRRRVKALIHTLAPAKAEERRRKAAADRHVNCTPAEDGMAWLNAFLPGEDATALMTVLNAGQRTLKQHDTDAGNSNARTADQRRADVLAHLAWTTLTTGHIGTQGNAADDQPSADSDTRTDHASPRQGTDTRLAADSPGASGQTADDDPGPTPDGDGASQAEPHLTGDEAGPDATGHGEPASSYDRSDVVGHEKATDVIAAGPLGPSSGEPPPPAARMAAACPRCRSSTPPPGPPRPLRGITLSSAHRRAVTVQLNVALSTELGLDDQPGYLAGYGPIPAHVARRLSTTGIWQWIGTDPVSGATLSHGRTRYTPTQDLVDHIILRDQTCKAPGCAGPAHTCELDHTDAYPDGATDADNLGLLCKRHHLIKHHSQWDVEQPSPGTFRWTSPTGRTITIDPTRVGPTHDSAEPSHPEPSHPEPRPPEPARPPQPPERGTEEPPF